MKKAELMRILQLLNQPFTEAYNLQRDVTAAGTAERVTDQDTPMGAMMVKAKRANTGYIYVGFDDDGQLSSSNGVELEAKDSIMIPLDNANKVWLDSSVNGEGTEIIIYR